MSGTWWALGAVGVLAAVGSARRGSAQSDPVTVRAEQIRERFQGDPSGYLPLARLARARLRGGGPGSPTRFPPRESWARWTEPDPPAEFADFVNAFYEIWKSGEGVAEVQAQLGRRAAAQQQSWMRSPLAATLQALLPRADAHGFREWVSDHDERPETPREVLELLETWLDDERLLSVREDGLVEVGHDLEDQLSLLGEQPIAVFHGTSTALLPSIRRHGLRPPRTRAQKTDRQFSSAAGVYVKLRPDVDHYSLAAVRRHGGDRVHLTIRAIPTELEPDPDDQDQPWATRASQFVLPLVPPSDIMAVD